MILIYIIRAFIYPKPNPNPIDLVFFSPHQNNILFLFVNIIQKSQIFKNQKLIRIWKSEKQPIKSNKNHH